MGGGPSSVAGRRQQKEVRPKLDLPWIQQAQASGSSGSDKGPGTPSQTPSAPTRMAAKSDDVFENASYIFVVLGASVSCIELEMFACLR